MLISVCLLTAACSRDVPEPGQDPEPTASVVPSAEPVAPTEGAIRSINYYIADPALGEIVVETAFVETDRELVPDQIMEFIIDSMSDRSIDIDYEEVTESGEDGAKVLTVDFTSSIRNVGSYGGEFERLLLDAVAQSLLDNIPDSMHISFLIEGEAYKTDNCDFEKGYFYMDR
ncbi:MAG: GerMN domain-containing protein [Lachnospiraceae bacterium]|nr:GerMN domain-containing protein [Lachnospiraceae bacterium]